jgi:hypothetical protein
MNTEKLVSKELVDRADAEVRNLGRIAAMQLLRQVEPNLFYRIAGGIQHATEALDDSGVESEVTEAVANVVVRTAVTCVYALRSAHYALWRDMAAGSLLQQIDPTLPDTPRGKPAAETGDGREPRRDSGSQAAR